VKKESKDFMVVYLADEWVRSNKKETSMMISKSVLGVSRLFQAERTNFRRQPTHHPPKEKAPPALNVVLTNDFLL
jgi:hypothetical protein